MPPFKSRSRQNSAMPDPDAPVVSNKPRRSVTNIFGSGAAGSAGSTQSLTVPAEGRKSKDAAERSPKSSPEPEAFVPASGHPGNLSEEQHRAFHEFEKALVDANLISLDNPPPHQYPQLLRFLRARNFDVGAAQEMYVNAEKWKESIELDKLYDEFEFEERDVVAKHGWRMYFHKTDRLGRPIFIQDLSNLEPDKVFSHTTPDRIVRNFAVTLEHTVRHKYHACTEKQGHLVDDNYMVLNVAGLGLGTFWSMKGQLQQLLSILDDNFPELSGRVQIINAPYLFTTVWSYIKGWLPAQTAAKIDIAGSDYLPKIASFVDMEAWPKHLGGKCECCETCSSTMRPCETSDAGPWNTPAAADADETRKQPTDASDPAPVDDNASHPEKE
ncbi:hypothetical protein MBRA1_001632 [Malassezia brasiliensis]|uniref:CRAL-TRIO domain-containing protein n=1 Tax=Malassezia brasiliensis TaxID=1821822 RepID=A0AAF0DS06_9BASI|nr:hypothetical protein MBRA1_001632 [Malassezia brasiliensis]